MLTREELLAAAERADRYPRGYGAVWGTAPALSDETSIEEMEEALRKDPSLAEYG